MMKKFQLGKDILSLIVFTLITVLTWVGFEVWISATKSTIPKTTKEQMTALNPNISREVIESLKIKVSLPEEELNKSNIDNSAASVGAEFKEENEVATSSSLKETENNATASSQKATESGILE